MKTLAAVLTKIGEPLEILSLTIPPLKEGQVLVQMKYSGICRSQINEIKGLKGEDRYLPHTLGHEGSGIVLETGPKVTKVRAGDHVILTWLQGKGLSPSHTTYLSNSFMVNSGPISTFMEKTVVAESRIIPIPKNLPLREASLFGCAIPTGAGIVFNQLHNHKNSSLAIFGLGGIGLSALFAATLKKVKNIIAIDCEEEKLMLAKKLGATHTLLFTSSDLLPSIQECTKEEGVDFSIEAVGKKETMEAAFHILKSGTGLCILAGNTAKNVQIHLDPFDFIKGKTVTGTWGGQVNPDRDIPLFFRDFLDNQVPLASIITHEAPLEKIHSLLHLLEKRKTGRAFLSFE